MKTDFDVIIIGAGPAGSSCAKQLSKNGIKTLIVEKKKMPRIKCCSGLYSERSTQFIRENFGEIPEQFICDNKKIAISISRKGTTFYPISDFIFTNMNRAETDYWLLNNSGTEFINNCVMTGFSKNENKITVSCHRKDNNSPITLTCSYLIDATGARSKIRQKIDPNYKKENTSFALQGIFKGAFPIDNSYYYVLRNKKFSDFFAYMNIKNDCLYIGTSANGNKEYFDKWLSFISETFNLKLKAERYEGGFIEIFKDETNLFFGEGKILSIGESAGLISNISEGIPSALISGKAAALAILEKPDNPLPCYREAIQTEIDYLKTSNLF